MLRAICLSVLLWCGYVAQAQTFYKDIRYAPARRELQKGETVSDRLLNITLPATNRPEGGYPVVVYIHGGAFDHGSKDEANVVVSKLLQQGYAIVSIDYYLTAKYRTDLSMTPPTSDITMQGGTLPPRIEQSVKDGTEDATLALQWLAQHGADYGLDVQRVALYGGSSGAMIALYAAYHDKVPCGAVIDLWGELNYPTDITQGDAPLLIVHGMDDTTIPVAHAQLLRERAEAVGLPYECYLMKGRGHAQYDYVSKTYMKQIDVFLQQHIPEVIVPPFMLKVYHTDGTWSEVVAEGWSTDLLKPNEIAVVDAAAGIVGTNVVTCQDDGAYVCQQLVLTDGVAFGYDGPAFVASHVTYTRPTPTQRGTLCLPFAFDATQCADVRFCTVQEADADLMLYADVTTTQPYQTLIYCTASAEVTSFTIEAHDVTISPLSAGLQTQLLPEWSGRGSMTLQEVCATEDEQLYYLNQNQLWHTSEALLCPPFRCYFVRTTPMRDAALRSVLLADAVTGLDALVSSPAQPDEGVTLSAICDCWPRSISQARIARDRMR